MSKPRATVARKNSLADKQEETLSRTGLGGGTICRWLAPVLIQMNLVHLDSSHVGMVTVAGRGCPAGLGWISGPGGGGLGTWARSFHSLALKIINHRNSLKCAFLCCILVLSVEQMKWVFVCLTVSSASLMHAGTSRHQSHVWWMVECKDRGTPRADGDTMSTQSVTYGHSTPNFSLFASTHTTHHGSEDWQRIQSNVASIYTQIQSAHIQWNIGNLKNTC